MKHTMTVIIEPDLKTAKNEKGKLYTIDFNKSCLTNCGGIYMSSSGAVLAGTKHEAGKILFTNKIVLD